MRKFFAPQVDIAPEILAELEQKEDHANALALSLMAKENELEHLQVDLKVSSSTFYPTAMTDGHRTSRQL